MLISFFFRVGNARNWIGLYRDSVSAAESADAGWMWLDRSNLTWTNWRSGRPKLDHQCALLSSKDTGTWTTILCDKDDFKYICKKVRADLILQVNEYNNNKDTTIKTTINMLNGAC